MDRGPPITSTSHRSSQGVFSHRCLRKASAANTVITGLEGSAGIADTWRGFGTAREARLLALRPRLVSVLWRETWSAQRAPQHKVEARQLPDKASWHAPSHAFVGCPAPLHVARWCPPPARTASPRYQRVGLGTVQENLGSLSTLGWATRCRVG